MKLTLTGLAMTLLAHGTYAAPATPSQIWADATAKRIALPGFQQQFERTSVEKSNDYPATLKEKITIDVSGEHWRETRTSTGDSTAFDGHHVIETQAGDNDEYVLPSLSKRASAPQPDVYDLSDADWARAQQISDGPCGAPYQTDSCVLLRVFLPATTRTMAIKKTSFDDAATGTASIWLDETSGLILAYRAVINHRDVFGHGITTSSETEETYTLLDQRYYPAPLDSKLFAIPPGAKRVADLRTRTASAIRNELQSKTAPDLDVTDLQGDPLRLTDFPGKTILLDFFSTWCGPCRDDAPALNKLYSKYKDKNLVIIGISSHETRDAVENYFQHATHAFPIVLGSENTLPAAYRIAVIPTYMVIDVEGKLRMVKQGRQGYQGLRRLLDEGGFRVPKNSD